MCINCGDSSIIVPIGDEGLPGFNGVSIDGTNGVEEHVTFDTSLNITYTGYDFISSIPVDFLGNPDLTAFRTVGYFIFPGTDNLIQPLDDNSPNKAYLIANIVSGVWLVRIRNSSDVTVAEGTVINPVIDIVDLGAISNLPSDVDIFTIEVYLVGLSDPTNSININGLSLTKE
jgi:hypothetical protein